MKPQELIEKLKELPQDKDVYMLIFDHGEEYWSLVNNVEYGADDDKNVIYN